ncbi:MAG TPA: beta-L-arabinofuranosidase domain-containing protein [Gemmataceae bacterium]|nr:beta-L-arabinofuranosidase domain-containing protein [Gemmataceae bacterium]
MSAHNDGRAFPKTALVVAAVLAIAARGDGAPAEPQKPAGVQIGGGDYKPLPDYPIRQKRHADVRMMDEFWAPKIKTNAEVSIPFLVQKLGENRGFGANVLEAAMLSLATHPDPRLKAQVEARVRALSQMPGGGNRDFEIAATWFNLTGRRELLDNAIKAADKLYANFATNNLPFSGGERDAINCVQLYRVTHDKKHLDLARHYLDIRGLDNSVNRSRHNQSYRPVLEQSEAVGHAVNCVSLMVSLSDVGVLAGLSPYSKSAQRMWADAVEKKMYITGGVGTTGNEGFGEPYVLPNISAYSETCAVLMFITLNHKMFLATGDSRYIDVMERGMYNNAIAGVSPAGNRFFYVNRLASAGDGRDLRWEKASLECCPPNLVRFFASMPAYIYAQDPKDVIYVNLYASSETTFDVAGKPLGLAVKSEMPWGGKSDIHVSAKDDVKGTIKLRIPGWACNQPTPGALYSYTDKVETPILIAVNGAPVPATADKNGYVSLERLWKNGDLINIDFPMPVRRVVADARVKETRGRVAIERGPVVYCAEGPDVAGGKALDLLVDAKSPLKPVADKKVFGGVMTIQTEARSLTHSDSAAKPLTLIPYYLWANRGAGEMTVWLPMREFEPGDIGPAGGYIFYVNPNWKKDAWRYLEAAPFDQSVGAKWGSFRKLIPGAKGTAVGAGKQNTLDILAGCDEPGTAARLCADLSVNGVGGWFLPSRDELALVYRNLKATGAVDFGDKGVVDNFTYWTSSQQSADMAAHIDFADSGRQHGDDKDFPRRVRAIRAF